MPVNLLVLLTANSQKGSVIHAILSVKMYGEETVVFCWGKGGKILCRRGAFFGQMGLGCVMREEQDRDPFKLRTVRSRPIEIKSWHGEKISMLEMGPWGDCDCDGE